jgi:hypothetical protein
VRTPLPGGAGDPSCTESQILIPLWGQPKLCVVNWAGQLIQVLGHTELGLADDDWVYTVSPVHDGRISLHLVPASGGHHVLTYEVSMTSRGSRTCGPSQSLGRNTRRKTSSPHIEGEHNITCSLINHNIKN